MIKWLKILQKILLNEIVSKIQIFHVGRGEGQLITYFFNI